MDQNASHSPPKILVLDDEEVQRMTVHLQLKGVGRFVDFSSPDEAIAYLRANEVDAAVVDIRMPNQEHDGLWFLAQLREFDRMLGVVLRTADEDIAIAQAGIEARAVQRVIKSQPNAKDLLRSAVLTAVAETRERRTTLRLAGEATDATKQISKAIGRADDELTVAKMSKGFIQGITSPLTALIGYSELLMKNAPSPGKYPQFQEILEKNRALALKLAGALDSFLENPYIEAQGEASDVSAEQCVASVEQVFTEHPLFADGKRKLVLKRHGFLEARIAADKNRVLSALRHLVEYCAMHSQSLGEVLLIVSVEDRYAVDEHIEETGFARNRRWLPDGRSCVFTVRANMPEITKARADADLSRAPENPMTGNLNQVATAAVDESFAITMSRQADGVVTLSLVMPVAV